MRGEGQTKPERPGEDGARAGTTTRGEARMAEGTTATTSVRTLTSKGSDDGTNDGLPGETKRPGEWRMVAGGVATIAGTVVMDAAKELSQLMRVNPSTRAAGTGEDAGAVSTTVAVVVRASRPQGRRSRGKRPEKPVCAEPEPRNRLSATKMAARDIIKGHEGTGKKVKEGSISKEECKQEEHYR